MTPDQDDLIDVNSPEFFEEFAKALERLVLSDKLIGEAARRHPMTDSGEST